MGAKKIISYLIIFAVGLNFRLNSQNVHVRFSDRNFNVAAVFEKEMLNGHYISYYGNGVKKSEGNFKNNNRVGEWTLWDSLGNQKLKRRYENSFVFIQTFPSETPLISYSILRNKNGYIEYIPVKEKDILWEKRLLRKIDKTGEEKFFDAVKGIVIGSLVNHSIPIYNEEGFWTKLPYDSMMKFLDDGLLLSFRTKEDVFFDKSRQMLDRRVIGICPVLKYKNDTINLGWIYYPQLRNKLSLQAYKVKDAKYIKNCEDVFYFSVYPAEIEKELNVYGRSLRSYCKSNKEIVEENERIIIDCIEAEHDYLLSSMSN